MHIRGATLNWPTYRSGEYAIAKLSNIKPATLGYNYFGGLAVASILFGIWGVLDHHYAATLLTGHMSTVLHFDDQSRMFVHYVSEPILAEAASHLMYRVRGDMAIELDAFQNLAFPGHYLSVVLQDFDNCIRWGYVDAGDVSKLVGRILLSLVYAKIHIDITKIQEELNMFSDAISFAFFLDLLIGSGYQKYYRSHFNVSCYNLDHENAKIWRDCFYIV
jgi:hypothetical protein